MSFTALVAHSILPTAFTPRCSHIANTLSSRFATTSRAPRLAGWPPSFGSSTGDAPSGSLPESDRRPDELYLHEVERCEIYVGLFGDDYGNEDETGMSPTEQEFDRATAIGAHHLIFVKGTDDGTRHPKMRTLIGKAQTGLPIPKTPRHSGLYKIVVTVGAAAIPRPRQRARCAHMPSHQTLSRGDAVGCRADGRHRVAALDRSSIAREPAEPYI